MNRSHFDKYCSWQEFSFSEAQTLQPPPEGSEPSADVASLFGEDFAEYATATELNCVHGMVRSNLHNFPDDTLPDTAGLCHFGSSWCCPSLG
jgi:hypothetical protein